MVDVVMIRTFEQTIIERFAAHSRVPVINGLTNEFHPCQILADIFTFIEHRGSIRGRVVAWVGDGNNMANTWLQAAELLGFAVHVSTPSGYEVDQAVAGLRSNESWFTQDGDHCVQCRLVRIDPVQKAAHELNAREFPGPQPFRELCQRLGMHAHSITLGTRYSPAATCGALR